MAQPDPTSHMIAALTLIVAGDNRAAAQYINGLPPRMATLVAATACANIAELIRDTAREVEMSPEALLQQVALRAARLAA